MSATAAFFVLMNSDLVAVPLQLEQGAVATVYCGKRRADQMLSSVSGPPESVARRLGAGAGEHRSACNCSSLSPICLEGREPRVPARYAAMVD